MSTIDFMFVKFIEFHPFSKSNSHVEHEKLNTP